MAKYRLITLTVLSLIFLASFSMLHSAIEAHFSGGVGTEFPDQWTGTAGDGWATAWDSVNADGTNTTFSLKNDSPFPQGGNYLQVNYLKTGTDTARSGIRRQFVSNGGAGIDSTRPYTISFQFRIDSINGWDDSADQFAFSTESGSNMGSFGTNSPWSIWLRGDNGWSVGNGNGNGNLGFLNFSELGLTGISVGEIYYFEIMVDPTVNGYDATITVDGTTYRASDLNNGELLGFRTNSGAVNANWLQIRNTLGDSGDAVSWSVDGITIIPEPGSIALIIGCAFFVVLSRHVTKRRR